MKIYILKTLEDLGHVYKGIDGIETFAYPTLQKAQEGMSKFAQQQKERFLETGWYDEEEIEVRIDENSFDVSDGEDIVHGEIVEVDLDLDIFAVTTVSVEPYEPSSVTTYFRTSKEEADLEYEEIKNNLYNEKLEEFDAEEDEVVTSQEKLDDFISAHVQNDYEFTNGNRYFHAVYNEGCELIISTEKLELKKGDR